MGEAGLGLGLPAAGLRTPGTAARAACQDSGEFGLGAEAPVQLQRGLGPRLGCGPGPLPGDTGHTSSQGPGSALPAGAGDPPPASPQGGCATFLCQPLDVLKTRLMNSQGEYRVSARPARPLGAAASAAGHLVTPPVSAGCHPLCHGDCQARAPRLLQGTSPGRVGRPVGRLGAEVALSGCGARAFQGSAACSPTASCARPCPGPGAL